MGTLAEFDVRQASDGLFPVFVGERFLGNAVLVDQLGLCQRATGDRKRAVDGLAHLPDQDGVALLTGTATSLTLALFAIVDLEVEAPIAAAAPAAGASPVQ